MTVALQNASQLQSKLYLFLETTSTQPRDGTGILGGYTINWEERKEQSIHILHVWFLSYENNYWRLMETH